MGPLQQLWGFGRGRGLLLGRDRERIGGMNLQSPLSLCPLSPAFSQTTNKSEGMWHTEASLPRGQLGGHWNGGEREYPTLKVYQKVKRY